MKKDSVEFTVALAQRVLDAERFEAERPLRDATVEMYATAMREGLFEAAIVDLAICKFEGRTIRLNGQHCAHARLAVKDEWKAGSGGTEVNFLQYEVTDYDEVRGLYVRFDRGAPRTRSHVTIGLLMGTPEFQGIGEAVLKSLSPALSVWLWDTSSERARHSPNEVAGLLRREHLVVAKLVSKFLEKWWKAQRHLSRGPVIATMLATASKSGERTWTQFWSVIANGAGVEDEEDPRLKLRDFLIKCKIGAGNNVGNNRRVSGEIMYKTCLAAWNAWREKRKPQYLRATEKDDRPEIVV